MAHYPIIILRLTVLWTRISYLVLQTYDHMARTPTRDVFRELLYVIIPAAITITLYQIRS